MKLLEDKIRNEGQVIGTDILKVDMFLNHQIDVNLLDEMGKEFYRLFKDKGINKILTVESSGIAIAVMAAKYFNVPVVFAKKAKSINLEGEMYTAEVESFTHKNKKRRQVIRFKGTAIPTQHINTTHAIAQAFVSIVLLCLKLAVS